MSQPPAGGYPPPEQPPPGGYPPPAQPGPPAGGYPPPAPGYSPPPAPGGYQPPPAPGYAPPPPGYQPPPAQGGYPPPPQAGYPPAQGGYPPPVPGYGPPGAQPPAARSGASSFDLSKISTIGWGVIGAAFLTLVASFFNFWSVTVAGFGSTGGYSGWSLWWWIPVLVAVAVGAAYALTLFGILKAGQIKPEYLFYGAAASFVLMIFVLIHTFAYDGPYGVLSDESGFSAGPSFGVWFALVTTLALTYFTALAAQASGGKLPFKVPGPTA